MPNTKKTLQILATILGVLSASADSYARQVITISPSEGDTTPAIRRALENTKDKDLKLVFSKGTYRFFADSVEAEMRYITNHDKGLRKIIFKADGFDSIEIEGNGAAFIFHGQAAPFVFENCEKVTMSNLSIDWDIPFLFQAEVIGCDPGKQWMDVRPLKEGFSWSLEKGKIKFPDIDGFSFSDLGHTYPFDPQTKDVVYAAKGMNLHPDRVDALRNGLLRIHGKMRYCPPVGSMICSNGTSGETRYAPGVYVLSSKNINIDGVIIHHCLGMGFLFERAADIVLKNSGVYLQEGSNRVGTAVADATHFCNCKGEVLVENCRFENMFDDATNVHGTYVFVDEVINAKTVRIELRHRQQLGYTFAEAGDEIWFSHQPSIHRSSANEVVAVKKIDAVYSELTFKNKLPTKLAVGDALENKTWNPSFTMRGCRIGNHRARNIVLKSPLKTVIENNDFFSSDMASILFRGETLKWFESGPVTDVLIRNNHFSYCNHGSNEQAVLYISPRSGKTFSQTETFDRNIRFIDNTIETFGNRIVWAERAEGLVIKNNTITQTKTVPQLRPNAPLFELSDCRNVEITGNRYIGKHSGTLKADKNSRADLRMEGNQGFKIK